MVNGIENIIVLPAKGMSNRDIEEQIREIYNSEVSTSTISRITEKVPQKNRGLAKPSTGTCDVIVWMDRVQGKGNSKVIDKTVYQLG